MFRKHVVLLFFLLQLMGNIFAVGPARAQFEDSPVKIFGFFQLNFQQFDGSRYFANSNSFSMQQLNIFLQRDLDRNLRAFVNLEFVNNFSTSERWGAFNIAEAWLSYRKSRNLSLKAGLLLPKFNYLNDIKNKTALLPYVIRPIAYESSFNEILRLDEYVPQRAYLEAYGNHRVGSGTVNYTVYVGNSPNVNSDPSEGQTGLDTTDTFLFGGRVGLDYGPGSIGFSATYDRSNRLAAAAEHYEIDPQMLREIPRSRVGADLRLNWKSFSLEAEWIDVSYDEDITYEDLDFDFDLKFYYYTIFFEPIYGLKIYNGYWYSRERAIEFAEQGAQFIEPVLGDYELKIALPTAGVAYTLQEKLTLKAQYARVRQDVQLKTDRGDLKIEDEFNYIAIGFSVFL